MNNLIKLYKAFVKEYIDVLNTIDEGSYLTKKQKNLFKIGTIKRNIEVKDVKKKKGRMALFCLSNDTR